MGIFILEIDIMGVDIFGIDIVALLQLYDLTHFDINEPHCGICCLIFSSPEPWAHQVSL